MKVLLVDDHSLFVEGMYNLLEANGYDIIGTAEEGIEALAKARVLKPDLILMDIQMDECDGIAATKLIKAELPEIKIVILTMSEDDEVLFEAIRSGASGYLLKKLEAKHFLSLLAKITKGEPPIAPGMTQKIFNEFSRLSRSEKKESKTTEDLLQNGYNNFTPRQKQIFSLVVKGKTYREIGEDLLISESTVKSHMGKICAHLNVDSKAEVIAYGQKIGIHTEDEGQT